MLPEHRAPPHGSVLPESWTLHGSMCSWSTGLLRTALHAPGVLGSSARLCAPRELDPAWPCAPGALGSARLHVLPERWALAWPHSSRSTGLHTAPCSWSTGLWHSSVCSRSAGPRTAPPHADKPAEAWGRSLLIPTLCKSPPAFAPDKPVGEFTPAGAEQGGGVSPDPKISRPTAPSQLCPSCQAAPGAHGVLGKRLRFARRSPGDGRCHRGEL